MRALLPLLLLLPVVASANDSIPQEFTFEIANRDKDVFEAIEYELTVPEDLEVALQFSIQSQGGVEASLDGESQITWPEVLTHDVHGMVEGGYFELECDIPVSLDIIVDFDSLYSGSFQLWSAGLYMRDDTTFDGLLLPGGTPESVYIESDGIGIDTVNIPISIVTGLDVTLSMDIFPQASSSLTGVQVLTVSGDEVDGSIKNTEDAITQVDVPDEEPGWVDMESTWRGRLDSSLDIVFTPAVSACVLGACYEIFALDLPLELASFDEIIDFIPVEYTHPLPALSFDMTTYDFGEVEVGDTVNLPVPIENIGQLPLEGVATIEGSDTITVFPEYFFANAGQIDGVMISFDPGDESVQSAILVLESNDPVRPRIEIPVAGSGFIIPEIEDTGDLFDQQTEHVGGCGCDSTPAGMAGLWGGLLGLVMVMRRRRE